MYKHLLCYIMGSLLAMHSLAVKAIDVTNQVNVQSMTLVGSARVSRTVFEYTYRVTFANTGDALTAVVATASSATQGTLLIDGNVNIGALTSTGNGTTPNDTITIRQDRTIPFSQNSLIWTVDGQLTAGGGGLAALAGTPTSIAINAVYSYLEPRQIGQDEIEQLPDGVNLTRTQLTIGLSQSATVADANSALASINAQIVGMTPGVPYLLVSIPDPGNLVNLQSLIAELAARPGVYSVFPSIDRELGSIPSPTFDLSVAGALGHHLVTRGAAIWNLQSAVQNGHLALSPPTLVVEDIFGKGNLQPSYFWLNSPDPMPVSLCQNSHGYHVTGVAVGRWQASDAAGLIGALMQMPARIIDAARWPKGISSLNMDCKSVNYDAADIALFEAVREVANSGRVIINLSQFGSDKCDAYPGLCAGESQSEQWRKSIEGLGVPMSRLLHVVAAGNNSQMTASQASLWAKAIGQGMTGLSVENHSADVSSRPPNALGLGPDASFDGTIAAIGSIAQSSGVLSYIDPSGTTARMQGSSQAAPAVSAVASLVWALRPDFSAVDVANLIQRTATSSSGGAPLLDAYAAALATDRNLTSTGAPVRKAILDVDSNGQFDLADVSSIIGAFVGAETDADDDLEYSRFDLNGDGYTGGDGVSPFDLDVDGASDDSPQVTIPLSNEPLAFDERNVTDMGVLCYYIYSDLFSDDPTQTEAVIQGFNNVYGTDLTCIGPIKVRVTINNSAPDWYGALPGIAEIPVDFNTAISPPYLWYGNSGSTCYGAEGGFHYEVDSDAVLYPAPITTNFPYQWLSGYSFRRPCSSFVAIKGLGTPEQKIWLLGAVRYENPLSGNTREWQTRYYSGDAANPSTRFMEIGVSFNGFYSSLLDITSFSVELIREPVP